MLHLQPEHLLSVISVATEDDSMKTLKPSTLPNAVVVFVFVFLLYIGNQLIQFGYKILIPPEHKSTTL